MKKITLTVLACCFAFIIKAQVGYNYAQYDLGASAALNTAHTDFSKSAKRYAAQLQFTYNYTPFLNYIAEVQLGSIAGDDLTPIFPSTVYNYTNDYTTVAFRAQLQMGQVIDYSRNQFNNFLKNIYISGGVGVVYSDLKVYDTGIFSTEAKGSNVFIPLKAGYEFKFFNSYSEPWAKLDIGYQYNLVMSDNFDGISYGNNKDGWSQIVVGLKFALGGYTSHDKSISY